MRRKEGKKSQRQMFLYACVGVIVIIDDSPMMALALTLVAAGLLLPPPLLLLDLSAQARRSLTIS